MMKKKSILAVVVALVMSMFAVALVGCTKKDTNKPAVTTYTVTYLANGGKFADTLTSHTEKVKKGGYAKGDVVPTHPDSLLFSGWGESATATTAVNLATIPVTADVTYYAVWDNPTFDTYSITVNTATGGTVTASKTTAKAGDVITLTVTPNSGYELDTLVYNDGLDHDVKTTKSFTMPGRAVTVTATFKSTSQPQPTTYDVTVGATTNGTVTANKLKAQAGETVTLTVTPAAGYELDTLVYNDGTNHDIKATKSFTMPNKTVTVTATFKATTPQPTTYAVTVNPCTGGSVTADKTTAAAGDTVTLTVIADSDYHLDTLVYNDGSDHELTAEPYTFTMPAHAVSVTATFEQNAPDKAFVTFNANKPTTAGSVDGLPDRQEVKIGESADEKPNPTLNGYKFDGWFTNSACTGEEWTFETTVDSSITVYAKWTIIERTVTYSLNGGTNHADNPAKINVNSGVNGTVTLKNATKDHYTFDGWYTENTFADDKKVETITFGSKNITLYAKFTVESYAVTFDANKPSADYTVSSMPKPRDVAYGGKITVAVTPTLKGYTFGGWFKDVDCTDPWDFTNGTVSGITTLYANWTAKTDYTVTYDLDGGTNDARNPASYLATNNVFGSVSLELASKEHYEFEGWFDNEDLEGDAVTALTYDLIPDSGTEIKLYAKFTAKTYNITYIWGGDNNTYEAKCDGAPIEYTYGKGETLPAGNEITITNKGTDVYVFLGWCETAPVGDDEQTYVTEISTTDSENKIFYAHIAALPTYTVTFHRNDGTTTITGTDNVVENRKASTKTPKPRVGYTFGGWFEDAEPAEGDEPFNFNTAITADKELYAKWNIVTYTITYKWGDAVLTFDAEYNSYNVEKTDFVLPTPSETHYTFVGWFKTTALKVQVANIDSAYVGGLASGVTTITLYAKFTADTYTVGFDANKPAETSGTVGGMPENDATVVYNNVIGALDDDPTLTGYTFGGWYSDAACADADAWNLATDKVDGDMTLYAKWTIIEYTVSYELDGGTNHADNPTVINVNVGTVTLKDATKEHYEFEGWYTDSALTHSVTALSFASLEGDVTLYANYTAKSYTVTFNGNKPTETSGTVTDMPLSKSVVYNTAIGTAKSPKLTGYKFVGWFEDADPAEGTQKVDLATFIVTADKELYAKWEIINITVTYNLDDGTNGDNPATINVNSGTNGVVTLEAATKDYYTFDGWYTDSSFGASTKVTTITYGAANITLYAKFSPISHTVSYELDGGTNAAGNKVAYKITDGTVSLIDATKDYYTFVGWYKDAAKTQKVESLTEDLFDATEASTLTLYAKFEATEYEVEYKLPALPADAANTADNAAHNKFKFGDESYTLDPASTNTATTGYRFVKWQNATGATVTDIDISLFDKTGAVKKVTLTAIFSNKYTVTLNANGGTAGASEAISVTYGAFVTISDDNKPTWAHHTLIGWYTDADCSEGNEWDLENDPVTDNVELFAKWEEEEFAVAFNLNGVTATAIKPQTVKYGEKVTEPTTPTNVDNRFIGWYTDKACSDDAAWNFNDPVEESMILYAKWMAYTNKFMFVNGTKEIRMYDNTDSNTNESVEEEYTLMGEALEEGDELTFQVKVDGVFTIIEFTFDTYSKGVTGGNNKLTTKSAGNFDIYLKLLKTGTWTVYAKGGSIMLEDDCYLAGSMNGWGDAVGNVDYKFNAVDGSITLNVLANATFKIVRKGTQGANDEWIGYSASLISEGATYVKGDGTGDNNFKVNQAGKYKFVFDGENLSITRLGAYNVVVTFDAQDGTFTDESDTPVTRQSTNGTIAEAQLPKVERDGYEFNGWYTGENGAGSLITAITLSFDLTVYAKWTEEGQVEDAGYYLVGAFTGNEDYKWASVNPKYKLTGNTITLPLEANDELKLAKAKSGNGIDWTSKTDLGSNSVTVGKGYIKAGVDNIVIVSKGTYTFKYVDGKVEITAEGVEEPEHEYDYSAEITFKNGVKATIIFTLPQTWNLSADELNSGAIIIGGKEMKIKSSGSVTIDASDIDVSEAITVNGTFMQGNVTWHVSVDNVTIEDGATYMLIFGSYTGVSGNNKYASSTWEKLG